MQQRFLQPKGRSLGQCRTGQISNRNNQHSHTYSLKCQAIEGVKIVFRVKKQVEYGSNLAIIGSDQNLGQWDPKNAVQLHWNDGHVWTREIELTAGSVVEYKYIISSSQSVEWQQGKNFSVSLPSGGKVTAYGSWDGSRHDVAVVEPPPPPKVAETPPSTPTQPSADPSILQAAEQASATQSSPSVAQPAVHVASTSASARVSMPGVRDWSLSPNAPSPTPLAPNTPTAGAPMLPTSAPPNIMYEFGTQRGTNPQPSGASTPPNNTPTVPDSAPQGPTTYEGSSTRYPQPPTPLYPTPTGASAATLGSATPNFLSDISSTRVSQQLPLNPSTLTGAQPTEAPSVSQRPTYGVEGPTATQSSPTTSAASSDDSWAALSSSPQAATSVPKYPEMPLYIDGGSKTAGSNGRGPTQDPAVGLRPAAGDVKLPSAQQAAAAGQDAQPPPSFFPASSNGHMSGNGSLSLPQVPALKIGSQRREMLAASHSDLERLSLSEIRKALRRRGQPCTGNRQQLMARLAELGLV